jgi:type VI protein secretion system component VasK
VVIRAGALWAIGMIVAIPFVLWWARDFARIPGRTWFWSGHDPRPWRWAVFLGFLAGGVIAIVTTLRWQRSDVRDELLDELRERRAEHAARRAPEREASVHPLQRTVTGTDARTTARRPADGPRRSASG